MSDYKLYTHIHVYISVRIPHFASSNLVARFSRAFRTNCCARRLVDVFVSLDDRDSSMRNGPGMASGVFSKLTLLSETILGVCIWTCEVPSSDVECE